jgi:urea transporter
MSLLSAIVEGEVDWADFFFLLGAILAVIAAVLHYPGVPNRSAGPWGFSGVLMCLAVASISTGFLML